MHPSDQLFVISAQIEGEDEILFYGADGEIHPFWSRNLFYAKQFSALKDATDQLQSICDQQDQRVHNFSGDKCFQMPSPAMQALLELSESKPRGSATIRVTEVSLFFYRQRSKFVTKEIKRVK